MVNLIDFWINAVKAVKKAKDKELWKDSSNRQEWLIKESKEMRDYAVDKYNKFMDAREQIREKFNTWELTTWNSNTDIATWGMSRVFDFVRDVWATVYWNPEVYKVDDNTIAKTAWLTWDNISYENISTFNDYINNPTGWDLTWTVYKLVSWDKRMRQYMDAKYYWGKSIESWEGSMPTLYWALETAARRIENIPVIWWLLTAWKDVIWGITDAAVWTISSIADSSINLWKTVLTPLLDTDLAEWVYNIDKANWYKWSFDEWKEQTKETFENLSVHNKRENFKKEEIPERWYDEDEITSEWGKTLFTIGEMLMWWGEKKIAEYATKPWVVWNVAKFLDKVIKAWATESEAKWYLRWLSRAAEWWAMWAEAQWLTDLAEWELSSLDQYKMSAWAWAFSNVWLKWMSSIYENVKSPNEFTKTSLSRLDTEEAKNIWKLAKSKYKDASIKSPTQKLWGEVETVISKEVKPGLDIVWKDIVKTEDALVKNTNITADNAIDNINKILEDKWINIKIEPVEIDWKIYYRSNWGGNIIKYWDTYVMEQDNPYINSIIWDINKITPSEFNTAKWYSKVIKALKRAGKEYKKEWWEMVGKLWSEAENLNKPLKDIMWDKEFLIYENKNNLYSEIGKFQKSLSEVEQSLSKGQTIDPTTINALEAKARQISKLAKDNWYEFNYDLDWLTDRYIVWKSAEKFYKTKSNEQETVPRPSFSGSEKWAIEEAKKWAMTKPEEWYKYAWNYKPSAWEQMFKEIWDVIPWVAWEKVWEFTYK